jgi:L-ascorbate metabolism protein UlaG (beta-lactamase superfamily)
MLVAEPAVGVSSGEAMASHDLKAARLTAVTYVGHSTVLIEADGTRLLTDPVLGRRVAHLRRIAAVPEVAELASLDAVLISHAHHDHLDLPSLRRLAPSVLAVVPRDWAGLARRAGLRRVAEVEAGDRVTVGAVEVVATPAAHDGRRLPFGRSAEALGYVVEGRQSVYFAGDTDLFDGMGDLVPQLDLALLPVAGWGPRLPPGHLDPAGAARAAALLRPRVAVPIHWGTFAARTLTSPGGRAVDPDRPAREFARFAGSRAPRVEVRILHPGQRMRIAASDEL